MAIELIMRLIDILRKFITFVKVTVFSLITKNNPRKWKWSAIISAVAALISAAGAIASWKITHSEYIYVTIPQATLKSLQATTDSDRTILERKLATLESGQAFLTNIKATEEKALRQPEIQMRVFVGESPDLKADDDVNHLNSNYISFTRVLPTPYMNLLLEQDSVYPNKRYLFILLINRGEERAESVKIDNLVWTPKQGNPPDGLGDFPKVYESLEVNNAYALLVDAFDFPFNDISNLTHFQMSNLAHFQNVCAYFTYTNFMGELLTYLGKPCISDVIDLPLVTFPIE